MKILAIIGIIAAVLILWMVFDVVRGALSHDAPRNPQKAGDGADYDYSGLQLAVWLIEHQGREKTFAKYVPSDKGDDSPFAWREVKISVSEDMLNEAWLLECIRPAADYMAKRYDCSDFRAIWLCRLKYALLNSSVYGDLLTPAVDGAIREALVNFKYWITSEGADSMCYYSENHQMVFAVSEYLAGSAYPDEAFSIDGRNGREHAYTAAVRMLYWFDQRGRYGFSEFLSSNYLAVDIGALSMLRMYGADPKLNEKAELALNMILLDYALQMYDFGFTAPAGRNYARNNTSFMASTSSHIIVDKIWNTREAGLENVYGGFAGMFISLIDSGKYSVPDAIVEIGRDNSRGAVRTTSGLTLKEMQQKKLVGLSDYRLMLQLGMGALSNGEVIDNTLKAIDRFDLVHNNFVSNFKYFNIKLLRYLGLTGIISQKLNPFSNGMAIQRNEVYTYCCEEYKLSTNQMYFPGSFGAQQLQQIACLPRGINVFTANPIKNKEFQGYGVAPCAAQNMNCMLSIYNIPEKKILLAPGSVRAYTSTYMPEEKFDEVIVDGNYAFGRVNGTYMALIGASSLRYETYADRHEFEKLISERYGLYEGNVGPYVDSFRLHDCSKGFDLRQEGNKQYTVYEMGRSANETFAEFMARIRNNRITFEENVLTYETCTEDLGGKVTYVLDYAGEFIVNGHPVSTEHERYDSRFIHAARDAVSMTVEHGEYSYTFDLTKMLMTGENYEIQYTISERS